MVEYPTLEEPISGVCPRRISAELETSVFPRPLFLGSLCKLPKRPKSEFSTTVRWKTEGKSGKTAKVRVRGLGNGGCKAKVTHTFHNPAVENSKFTKSGNSAICPLDKKKRK